MPTHNLPAEQPGFRADLAAVARTGGVVMLGFIALGTGFGVLASNYGYPWWFAYLISLLVYAGSAEFLLVGLLAAGTPLVSVAVSILIINSRHLFYGLTFPIDKYSSFPARFYGMTSLSDETYAVLTPDRARALTPRQMMLVQIALHATWSGGTLLGAVLGSVVIGEVKGLEFLLIALFLVLAIDAIKARPSVLMVGLTICVMTLAYFFAGQVALPVAMFALVVLIPIVGPVADRVDPGLRRGRERIV